MIRGLFMQTVPLVYNRIPRLYMTDSRGHIDHEKKIMSDKEEKIILHH